MKEIHLIRLKVHDVKKSRSIKQEEEGNLEIVRYQSRKEVQEETINLRVTNRDTKSKVKQKKRSAFI